MRLTVVGRLWLSGEWMIGERTRGKGLQRRVAALALALAWPWACLAAGGGPPATPLPQSQPSSQAAVFDSVFERIVGPVSLDASSNNYEQDLERLRASLPPGDAERDVRLRSVYCGSTRWKDANRGLAYSDEALRMARAGRDGASEVRALLCRAAFLSERDGSRHAIPDLDRAVGLVEKLSEPLLQAETLVTRGDLLSLIGEQAKAMLDYQRARAAFRDAGIDHEIGLLLQGIATAYRRMGDYAQASSYFEQARKEMEARQDYEGLAANQIQLGFLHVEAGAPDTARAAFAEAIRISAAHDDPRSHNAALLGLAEAQIALDQPDVALATLHQAAAWYRKEQDDSAKDMLLLLGGKALAKQGLHADALDHYRMAQPLMEASGNLRYLALLLQAQAASQEALGRDDDALASFKRYTTVQDQLQDKMRLEQGRLLQYEYEIRKRDFENQRLRSERKAQAQQLADLQRLRRWQTLALVSGLLLAASFAVFGWGEWRKSRRLRALTLVDPLTGAASRRGFDAAAASAMADAGRGGQPLSLLALDLDRFKDINDRYGHPVGDRVLAATAHAWQALLRERDLLARIGGEEFVVLCPDTSLEKARGIAARLLEATEALRFDDIDPALRVGVSIGLAQTVPGDSLATLHSRADAALYHAKQGGRGRVEG